MNSTKTGKGFPSSVPSSTPPNTMSPMCIVASQTPDAHVLYPLDALALGLAHAEKPLPDSELEGTRIGPRGVSPSRQVLHERLSPGGRPVVLHRGKSARQDAREIE